MEGGAQTQGSFFYSEKMNELIDQQRQEDDLAKRKAIFIQIQDILAEEVPYIPLWQNKDYAFSIAILKGSKLILVNSFLFGQLKIINLSSKNIG